MATKRRITIFPADRVIAPLPPSKTGQAADARESAGRDKPVAAAVITARGQRFSLSQIGSIFGSE